MSNEQTAVDPRFAPTTKDGFRKRKKRPKGWMKQAIKDGVIPDPNAPTREASPHRDPQLPIKAAAMAGLTSEEDDTARGYARLFDVSMDEAKAAVGRVFEIKELGAQVTAPDLRTALICLAMGYQLESPAPPAGAHVIEAPVATLSGGGTTD